MDDLKFTVDVFFPISRKSAPLHVKAFKTSLPLFAHVFTKLEGNVAFDSLKIYSSNERIYGDVSPPARPVSSLSLKRSDSLVQYIEAESATIMTSNARIEGKFHVSRSVDLQTTNQPIEAEVTLLHDAPTQGDASTNLTLHTANA